MEFPPPHRILFECLNDRNTRAYWQDVKTTYADRCDFEEIEATEHNSVEEFSAWLTQWLSFAPTQPHRIRLLMIWHAHFLSAACQQMMRRSLETRSFKCRVWFHLEEPTLQHAIVSRCVVTRMPQYTHTPIVHGTLDTALWDDPVAYEVALSSKQ
uniref:Uncharacterized protein n=1 Tax=viral metagenome TaxID=1070528 RepID=A0A6C0M2X5_9ZZZZ